MVVLLGSIAAQIGSEIESDTDGLSSLEITGINSPAKALGTEITFISSPKFLDELATTNAAAVILSKDLSSQSPVPVLVHPNPYLAYAQISALFAPSSSLQGIDSSATIDPTARLGSDVRVGPHAYLGPNVVIGDNTIVGANVSLGDNVSIGSNTLLHPNVSIYRDVSLGDDCIIHSGTVIGSDGFGFAPSKKGWIKIHQLGAVRVGSRVEIGANCSIDRGAIGDTVIADGVKLDNLVMVAHNVQIGENTALAGQVGIAGSSKVGKNCIFAGQVGITGHVEVCDGVTITGKAMVTKSITQPGTYSSGIPLSENSVWRKKIARINRLSDLFSRIKHLEKKIDQQD